MSKSNNQQWKSCSIFISSTFRDMQAERDHLRNFVFPRLEEELRSRRHHLEWIDLRQGVESGQAITEEQRELHVLKVCLDEIKRSRPFIIVLLGDRYGWVPPPERMDAATREAGFQTDTKGMSVTALEIEFGILKETRKRQHRCLFYLREPLCYNVMSEELRAIYSEQFATDKQSHARCVALEKLKQRLRDNQEIRSHLRTYKAEWDTRKNSVTDLEEWGNQVFEDLWTNALEKETRLFAAKIAPRWEESERAALAEFVQQHSRDFTGRKEIVKQLLALARSNEADGASWSVCVTGPSGSGKSALFAELFRRLDADSDILILVNAAGATQRGLSVDAMLRRWIFELATFLEIDNPLPKEAGVDQVDRTFALLLGQASEKKRVVVLLDALNQFESTPRARYLTWLKPKAWPPNVRLITTSLPGAEAETLAQSFGTEEIQLLPLEIGDAKDIAKRILRRYHIPWNGSVWQALAERKHPDGSIPAGNPLWITLACEQLTLLDADDFKRAERQYSDERDPQTRLTLLRCDIAERMPPDVPGLYEWLLAQTEKVHGKAQTCSFSVAIALSRHGWRETDLRTLVPKLAQQLVPDTHLSIIDSLKLAELRRAFRAQITVRGDMQQWDFSHVQMREVVHAHFINAPLETCGAHKEIARYLESLYPDDPLRRTEIMTHLLGANDIEQAAAYYADEQTTGELQDAANRALVEHAFFNASPSTPIPHDWILAMAECEGLSDEQRGRVCARLLNSFIDTFELTAPLKLLVPLTRKLLREFHTLLSRQNKGALYHGVLSLGEGRLAHYLYDTGDLQGAVEHSKMAVELCRAYVEESPENQVRILRLAEALRSMARLHRLLGEPNKSHTLLQEAESLLESCREPDVETLSPTKDGVVDLAKMIRRMSPDATKREQAEVTEYAEQATLALETGNTQQALDLYNKAIELNDRLRALACESQEFHETVWKNYQRLRSIDTVPDKDTNTADTDSKDIQHHVDHFLRALDLSELRDGLLVPARRLVPGLDRQQAFLYRQIAYVHAQQGNLSKTQAHFKLAFDIVEQLQAQDPSDPDLKSDLMHCNRGLGGASSLSGDNNTAADFYGKALALSEDLCRRYPDNVAYSRDYAANYISLGQLQQERGELQTASEYFKNALAICDSLRKQFPENQQLLEDYQSAEMKYACLQKVIENQAQPPNLSRKLRQSLNDIEKAEENPSAAVQPLHLGPGNWEKQEPTRLSSAGWFDPESDPATLNNIGLVMLQMERYGAASQCFEEALRKDPNLPAVWANKGMALWKLGHADTAMECFDRALAIDPNARESWHNKGIIYFEAGDYKKAAAAFRKSVELSPDSCDTWLLLARSLSKTQHYDEALSAVNEALHIKPSEEEAINLKADLLYLSARYDEAIAFCDEALVSHPQSGSLWCARGAALIALERPSEAGNSLIRATQADPNYVRGWLFLGQFLCGAGREDGIECLSQAVTLRENDGDLWMAKALGELRFKKTNAAIESLRRAENLGHTKAGALRRKLEMGQ